MIKYYVCYTRKNPTIWDMIASRIPSPVLQYVTVYKTCAEMWRLNDPRRRWYEETEELYGVCE